MSKKKQSHVEISVPWLAISFCCLLAGWVGASIVATWLDSDGSHSSIGISFEDSIMIVLSSLSIMITALAVIIAVVGAIGFNELKKSAFKAGMDHSAEQFGEEGALRAIILDRVNEIVAERGFKSVNEEEWGDSEKEYGE